MHYFKSHKSPRKVQIKEVHHSNETASIKVMTPDGVTLVQTNEKAKHKRRPAPPPPPKQPPKRPPPPPPPVTPPPDVVVVMNGEENESKGINKQMGELKIDVNHSSNISSNLQTSPTEEVKCPSSPELPLPPPPAPPGSDIVSISDDPLPPPPGTGDADIQPRVLNTSSSIYPKNSYMSYKSEKKVGRHGFNGKYTRSFNSSASSMDLTNIDSSFQNGDKVFSPSSWEEIHNIRQHGATVIFHSDNMSSKNHLQRSSSQNCVTPEEVSNPAQNDISNKNLENLECNQSSNSINFENECVQQKSVPYLPPSHENELKKNNVLPDIHQNNNSAKASSDSSHENENSAPQNEVSPTLDNNFQVKTTFEDTKNDVNNLNLDHNQNAVKKEPCKNSSFEVSSENHVINRTNSATQTSNTPRLKRKSIKSREELECEQLSKDFIDHYGDISLKNLLVPTPHRKTMYDYLEGLFGLEKHENTKHQNSEDIQESDMHCDIQINNEECNALYDSEEGKNCNDEVIDNENNDDLKKRKEELALSIGKKVDTLRNQQDSVKEEMLQNEVIGQEISNHLETLAKPNELEKYNLHVEEMEKILSLLLSLSGRLAKAENILKNLPKEGNVEEKKILELKRDKLKEQHDDAKRLKENIDRRSSQVSAFLHRYFTDEEFANYDRFLKVKAKLIIDIRELEEKINLGEEQLAALNVVAHLWKSANSCERK